MDALDAGAGGAEGGRTAIVLMNLGGPDSPQAVRPFLRNLFSDPAIIGLPGPLRRIVAWAIARRRAPVARAIYDRIGGRSPILPLTEAQAAALQAELVWSFGGDESAVRCFVAMRYWHPRAAETVRAVRDWGAERVLLLPLYPQFSTTTSASSIAEWHREAERAGLKVPTRAVCCFPDLPGLVEAQAEGVLDALEALLPAEPRGRLLLPRVLFSAHGLPKKVIAAGDPYQFQVESTAAAVAEAVQAALPPDAAAALDWRVCYQSRVGPLEWIGPSTEEEIRAAGRDGVPLVVVPIAFVSEHSETLVELDMDYAALAAEAGVPGYRRVPALGTSPVFIDSLAGLVAAELETFSGGGEGRAGRAAGRFCATGFGRCACETALAAPGRR